MKTSPQPHDERLAILGQMVSVVAHELNNPLATILAVAERLQQRQDKSNVSSDVTTIIGEAQRAARIVRNLLLFARKKQSTRTVVNINDVLRQTLSSGEGHPSTTSVKIVDALSPHLPHVFADAQQLQQVFLNLLSNARQAILSIRDSGTITLRSWHDESGGTVVIEIHDDGPGIPRELQVRVFDPFFTTSRRGQGTGLGLTVANAIVREHGGTIDVSSGPGQGSRFRVGLPALTQVRLKSPKRNRGSVAEPRAGQANGVGRAAETAHASVLLVEDEPALSAALSDALHDAGYAVRRASDGREAVRWVQNEPFDVVICDVQLPQLDGEGFYRAIADISPGLVQRTIFVTGGDVTDAARFIEESGCRWLRKPFRLTALLREVRAVLAYGRTTA